MARSGDGATKPTALPEAAIIAGPSIGWSTRELSFNDIDRLLACHTVRSGQS
jgi:hypothetical protein